MLRSLRDWFKTKKIGTGLPYLRRSSEVGPSRFLKARFKIARLRCVQAGYAPRARLSTLSAKRSSGRDSLPLVVMLHGCRKIHSVLPRVRA